MSEAIEMLMRAPDDRFLKSGSAPQGFPSKGSFGLCASPCAGGSLFTDYFVTTCPKDWLDAVILDASLRISVGLERAPDILERTELRALLTARGRQTAPLIAAALSRRRPITGALVLRSLTGVPIYLRFSAFLVTRQSSEPVAFFACEPVRRRQGRPGKRHLTRYVVHTTDLDARSARGVGGVP